MKVFIPDLGSKLTLAKDWVADVQFEDRNKPLLKGLKLVDYSELEKLEKEYRAAWRDWKNHERRNNAHNIYNQARAVEKKIKEANPNQFKVTIPAGTVLDVDAYCIQDVGNSYVRGAHDRSITFKWRTGKKVLRFWVRVDSANTMEIQ